MTLIINESNGLPIDAPLLASIVVKPLRDVEILVAGWYRVDPYLLRSKESHPAKVVYAYLLHKSDTMRSFYDAAYAARVGYVELTKAVALFDKERNVGTSFGRELDVMCTSFNAAL